ncbi:TPA: hypothetical protein ACG0FA_005013, partial [Escherichia coli]
DDLSLPDDLSLLPWLFTTAAGVVWDRLPTADPGGPATISSQAYAYYMLHAKRPVLHLCAYGTP